MNMIFPGMDPYLEDSYVWQGFHNSLVVYIRDYLQPQLLPRYVAAVEDRVYVDSPDERRIGPDVRVRHAQEPDTLPTVAVAEPESPVEVIMEDMEIHENYLEILDLDSGQRVVTVIEVISPTNKYSGAGRDQYVQKQREVRTSQTHLVEIDLLRAGPHVLPVPQWRIRRKGAYDYLVCVNRSAVPRDRFLLYLCPLRQRLPRISIPLAGDDPPVTLDLQAVVKDNYAKGGFRYRLRYDRPCLPPLSAEDQAWADELIRQALGKSGSDGSSAEPGP